ncbi:Flagellar basal body FlaE [gamma proteobacterium HdN1]|nr:Flagellar basal body FlaE [gamma proteobacterium HdN1]
MSFNIAISGLKAAQSDLEVTSNNIANVATTGFKKSRAEFGDIYATGAFGSTKTAIGSGVLLQAVSQQFNQGNMNFTQNTLDFGVSGEGFFVMSPNIGSSERIYTRAGAFGVNADGNVVNSSDQLLQVFPVNEDGTVTSTALSSTIPLKLPDAAGTPKATELVTMGVNLPADAAALDPALFDPRDAKTYTASTSVNVYDSLGKAHVAALYYVRDSTSVVPNTWQMFTMIDGERVALDDGGTPAAPLNSARFSFGNDGTLNIGSMVPATFQTLGLGVDAGGNAAVPPAPGPLTGWLNGPDPLQVIEFDITAGTKQFASPFTLNTLTQDGFSIGRLTGIEVDDSGLVRAAYSNGQTVSVGKVALARFPNPQGLSQIGNTSWKETSASGEALAGEAGTSSYGLIRAGALEVSNVDLTTELVGLITAQRNFQANAKSIETTNTVTNAIINLR